MSIPSGRSLPAAGPPAGSGDALLAIDELAVVFGGVHALGGVTCAVARGEVCGLIGPNGAGKTTMLNAITRLVAPTGGRVSFDGEDVQRWAPHQIAAQGIARTFQNVVLVDALSVLENVKLGAPQQRGGSVVAALLGRDRAADREAHALALAALEHLEIAGVADRRPTELPFGTLKRVELARALVSQPRLLLLDEPANGLTAAEVRELGELLGALRRERDLTIVLVEHHMGLVQAVADHAVVLDFGKVIADGTPAWACSQPVVVEAYLGTAA